MLLAVRKFMGTATLPTATAGVKGLDCYLPRINTGGMPGSGVDLM